MPKIIYLNNPLALTNPGVAELVKRAIASIPFAAPYGIENAAADIIQHVTDPNMFVLLGMEEGEPRALSMGYFPAGGLFPYPIVNLMYNEGSRGLLRALGEATTKVITDRGFSKAWAINGTGHSDKAWGRTLLPEGVAPKTIGSIIECAVE